MELTMPVHHVVPELPSIVAEHIVLIFNIGNVCSLHCMAGRFPNIQVLVPFQLSMPMLETFFESSFVNRASGPSFLAEPVLLVILEPSFVQGPVREVE